MIKYCPECGTKIDKEYKYCPNCGTELRKSNFEGKVQGGPVVVCPNCGEENAVDAYECVSCGAALKKVKPPRKKDQMEQPRRRKVTQGSRPQVDAQKSLDITKIIAIFAGVIGIALIILIATGVFEDDVEPVQQSVNNPQSGVNLGAVQQINDLEKRVQAEPDNFNLLLELAHLKNDNGFYEKAIADYRKYLEKNSADADARIDMGVCYYNLQQYDTAIEEMKKALEYEPDHQIGHLNLGIVNLAAGNLDESRNWLQRAEALNPNNDIGKRAQELLKNH
jgi:tetratricopeptide (TPR) repeat protein/DNA-directed RNA polymerase subunit RPC12/RpoP